MELCSLQLIISPRTEGRVAPTAQRWFVVEDLKATDCSESVQHLQLCGEKFKVFREPCESILDLKTQKGERPDVKFVIQYPEYQRFSLDNCLPGECQTADKGVCDIRGTSGYFQKSPTYRRHVPIRFTKVKAADEPLCIQH